MYSPAFHTALIDSRIEDLRRSRGTSIHSRRARRHRSPRAFSLSAMPHRGVLGQAPSPTSGQRS
jgi:hypothetical protein